VSGAAGYRPYAPLLVPKPWGDSIWTVDGPEVGYGFMGLAIPCPTRMSVVRLANGDLWVHSPVAHTPDLAAALGELGRVAYLIAPNLHHYVHLAEWQARYPDARVFALPALAAKFALAGFADLHEVADEPWSGQIATITLALGGFSECVFVHHASRTLIVTDLMQRFEAERIVSPLIRLILRAGGAIGPDGQPTIDMRWALRGHRAALAAGLKAVLALEPERIILSHGLCFESDARAAIERAFPALVHG
jgi:hypothetical protein